MTEKEPVAVWEALAEHFLDTETRHRIPKHALLCVEAGLTVARARDVWRYEVTPAVWPNGWSSAGEWMYWDTQWLVARIKAKRGQWPNRPGLVASMVYRLRVHLGNRHWTALERCMDLFKTTEPAARSKLADDLTWLAEHFFDWWRAWHADDRGKPSGACDQHGMPTLYTTAFLPIFDELAFTNEISACRARVEAALATRTPSPRPYRGRLAD